MNDLSAWNATIKKTILLLAPSDGGSNYLSALLHFSRVARLLLTHSKRVNEHKMQINLL